jgi:hypothetical protein
VQAELAEELRGNSADPALVNPAAGDFTSTEAGPLVDRGVPMPGNSDAVPDGLSDIGAVERIPRTDAIFANGFDP